MCTICEGDDPVSLEESIAGKRKAPGGLSEAELKVNMEVASCYIHNLLPLFLF